MISKGRKLLAALSIIFIFILLNRHTANAEIVSEVDGRTVYTVYTREEFLTEVYDNIMNNDCKALIRMTDETLVKEMSYEMGLRQKREDFYADATRESWTEDNEPVSFRKIIEQNPMEYIQEDDALLNTYGVYDKYGMLKCFQDIFSWRNYTLTNKSDGWYWEFFYDNQTEFTPSEYDTMMDKITSAMKTLNLGSKDDYHRLKAASDWIMANATYDDTLEHYSPYDNIVYGISVCDGYARATELVLRAIGYKAFYVPAVTYDHAWDIVLLDGKWYMIDNTWGDGARNNKYFLYGTGTAVDKIQLGGIIDLKSGGYYLHDLTQIVNDQTPLATTYYKGDGTTYYLNSWLVDISDENVRATVGDTIAIKNDQLTQVESSNPSVASVENGKIVCHKAGRVNITRTDGIYASHYFVLVSDKSTLSLSKNEYTLEKGKSTTIVPKVTGASVTDVLYSSSDQSIAAVSAEGEILAKKPGKAVITVQLGSNQVKVTVTVKAPPSPKISGLKESYTLSVGKTYNLTYTIADAGDLKITVTGGSTRYKIDEGLYQEVQTVKIGKITDKYVTVKGLEKGKTTITIKVGSISKKVTITVK